MTRTEYNLWWFLGTVIGNIIGIFIGYFGTMWFMQ